VENRARIFAAAQGRSTRKRRRAGGALKSRVFQVHAMPRVEPASFLTLHYRLAGRRAMSSTPSPASRPRCRWARASWRPRSSSACWGWRRARARCSSSGRRGYGERNPDMLQWLARKLT
jgi:FKBP-type peptidyl-prolyl cis-trans isomerase SlpA